MNNSGLEKRGSKVEPFVSVLTPVYNGGKFLAECIESVLNQTYGNWEYVLINNQSTDDSLEIMREYAAKDSRIRIHDNEEHLPQMKNLNHAFRQISPESKYCKVVHADDWLYPECISRMVALNEEHPSIGIVSAYRLDDRKVGLTGLPYTRSFYSGKEIGRDYFLNEGFYFGAPTSLLIRTDLIIKRDKVYVESHQGTDTGACLDLLKESDFGFVHQVLTFTRRHENSVTNTACREDYTWIHAKIYNTLVHSPHFLMEDEQEKCLKDDLNRYYTMLSRSMFQAERKKAYSRLRYILKELDLSFNAAIFSKYFLREVVLQFFKHFGIELSKIPNKTSKDSFFIPDKSQNGNSNSSTKGYISSNTVVNRT